MRLNTLKTLKTLWLKSLVVGLLLVIAAIVSVGLTPDTTLAQGDFCTSLSSEFQGFLDCQTNFSSFSPYANDGSLRAVNPSDYNIDAPDNARDFIRNVVNFALGFLGFIALIIVIYGGFLYVTAAGNEDQSKKGTDAIKQSIIGIIIIFGSVAIVNTILLAPNDGESGGGVIGGGGTGGGVGVNSTVQISGYNTASQQVQHVAQDLVSAYSRYVDNTVTVNNLTEFDVRKLTSRQSFIDYLENVKQQLSLVASRQSRGVNGISNTTFAVRVVIDAAIDPALELLNEIIGREADQEEAVKIYRNGLGRFFDDLRNLGDDIQEGFLDAGRAIGSFFTSQEGESGFNKRLEDINCYISDPALRSVQAEFDCTGAFDVEGRNDNLGSNIVQSLDGLLQEYIIKRGINSDYDEEIDDIIQRLNNIQDTLQGFGTENVGSNQQITNEQVLDQFTLVETRLNGIKSNFVEYEVNTIGSDFGSGFNSQGLETAFARNELIQDTLKELNTLFDQLSNIVFTPAVVRANLVQGSAPLVVQFDCLGSQDPANQSIRDESCTWDLDGDGQFGEDTLTEEFANCDENGGTTVSCTYREAGAYRVGVRVTSANNAANGTATPIAPGIAYITIQVAEPVARIDLVARANGQDYVLRRYDENGFIERDRQTLSLTLADVIQNEEGITFDASGTNRDDADTQIVRYEWDFGDGTGTEVGSADAVVTHQYAQEGFYNASLTVVDDAGNRDRKLFRVVISSLAANVEATPLRGDLGTEFIFDASSSRSNTGQISDYNWSIAGLDDLNIPDEEAFRYTFEEPGNYTATVTVRDAANNTDNASVSVLVESQAPKPFFTFAAPKPNQPSLIAFDARQSFDPDPEDVLTYEWQIFNAREGIDYEVVSGALTGNEAEAGQVSILFKNQDSYVMELTVSDQHQDERLRKEASLTADVFIQKLADVSLGENSQQAALLQDGRAPVTFEFLSEFGDTISVDFGDGETSTGLIQGGGYQVNHVYTTAGIKQVKATVTDSLGDQTTFQTRVQIGDDTTIIPVVEIKKGDLTYAVGDELPIFSRDQSLVFDASKSLNTNGASEGLQYAWDFGDSVIAEGPVVRHTYSELAPTPPGFYEVSVLVTSERDPALRQELVFPIRVGSLPPIINNIAVTALDPDDQSQLNPNDTPITPFPVRVQALGATDPDGQIREYRFYYSPLNTPSVKLGTKIVADPEAVLEVKTLGVEGEENEFIFCVDITDNEGNTVKCQERFDFTDLPKILAKNGRNERPTVSLEVNRTNVNVGESIQLSAIAEDPDGEIVGYEWDVDGDGSFANDDQIPSSNLDYTFTQVSPEEGFRIRVRVTDDNGATEISEPIAIFVDSILEPPTAAFTASEVRPGVVSFRNNSRADAAKGGSISDYAWDFNATLDSDGDGNSTNDIDSELASPEFTYDLAGTYQVTLSVRDNEGNTDVVSNSVSVNQSANTPTNTSPTPSSNTGEDLLEAVLTSNPETNTNTDTITLSGLEGTITFSFNDSNGEIDRVEIDKNVFFDTNSAAPGTPGDGIRNNDVDFQTTDLNQQFTTNFEAAWEPIRVKLTVLGADGSISTDTVDIVFESRLGGDSTLQAATRLTDPVFILALLAILGGIGVLFYNIFLPKKAKKKRKLTK